MTELTYEHHFVMRDVDSDGNSLVFGFIEDEDGGLYWGYGHQPAGEFVADVNRYLRHCDWPDEDLIDANTLVDHMLAYNYDGERFAVATSKHPAPEGVETFPVTRLWV